MAARQKCVIVPIWVWLGKGFVMWSPVGMDRCSPQQEASRFNSSGGGVFGCLCAGFALAASVPREAEACVSPALSFWHASPAPEGEVGGWIGLCCATGNPVSLAYLEKAACCSAVLGWERKRCAGGQEASGTM